MPWLPDREDMDPELRSLVDEVTGGIDASAGDLESWTSDPHLYDRPGEAAVPSSQAPPDLRKTKVRDR